MPQQFFTVVLAFVALSCGTLGHSARAAVMLDDFNRPDSTNMGPNWIEQSGDFQVINNRAFIAAPSPPGSLMTFSGQTATKVLADVSKTSNTFDYAALVLGYSDLNNNLFAKVQGGSQFTNAAFYFGNNGVNNATWSNSLFFALATPFTSARLTLSLIGSTAFLDIDTDFNGVADQSYSALNVPLGLLGTGIGLGGSSQGFTSLDNFSIEQSQVPEPASLIVWSLLGLTIGGGGWWRRRKLPA